MNFDLSDEQRQIRETFARFCDDKIIPQAAALDEAHAYPHALFKELGALGFFAMRYPSAVGGLETDLVTLCLALEEIARGSMSLAGCVTMQSLMGTKFLELLGNEDIRNRLLVPALRGEKIGAICMTEPNAGSDLGSIATSATKADGGYKLKGQKMWVTSAPVADFFTVFARAGEARRLTIFLIEKDFPGLHIGKSIPKMGVWALPTSELALDGARGALEEAIRYAGERQQFGKPINRYQAIQLKLAEMGTDLEAARCLVHYAAWLKDNDKPHHKEAAMAKLFASEAALQICDKAARIMASYGYSMEYAVQRHLRDIRFTLIGGGTSEILKLIIAKELSG